METHRLFFDQQNEYTRHPIFTQPIENGLHITCHEMVRPPQPFSRALGELVLANLTTRLDEPLDRLQSLEDTIAFLDDLRHQDRYVAQEAEELARNLTFQHRFLQ